VIDFLINFLELLNGIQTIKAIDLHTDKILMRLIDIDR